MSTKEKLNASIIYGHIMTPLHDLMHS